MPDTETPSHRLTTQVTMKNASGQYSYTLVIAESDNAAELAILGSRLLHHGLARNIQVTNTTALLATHSDTDMVSNVMNLALSYLESGKAIGDNLDIEHN